MVIDVQDCIYAGAWDSDDGYVIIFGNNTLAKAKAVWQKGGLVQVIGAGADGDIIQENGDIRAISLTVIDQRGLPEGNPEGLRLAGYYKRYNNTDSEGIWVYEYNAVWASLEGVPNMPENATDGIVLSQIHTTDAVQPFINGQEGKYVGFNSYGEAVAVDPPSSLPSGGSEGKLLGYGTEPEWVDSPVFVVEFVIDPSTWSESNPTITCNHTIAEIVSAYTAGAAIRAHLTFPASEVPGMDPYDFPASLDAIINQDGAFTQLVFKCGSEDGPYAITGIRQQSPAEDYWIASIEFDKVTTTNKTVPTSAWSSDSTYTDLGFNYRASVSVSRVTDDYIPDVNFSPADQYSGNLASFADTYNGGVYIYAKTQPTATVTIESAIFTRS